MSNSESPESIVLHDKPPQGSPAQGAGPVVSVTFPTSAPTEAMVNSWLDRNPGYKLHKVTDGSHLKHPTITALFQLGKAKPYISKSNSSRTRRKK